MRENDSTQREREREKERKSYRETERERERERESNNHLPPSTHAHTRCPLVHYKITFMLICPYNILVYKAQMTKIKRGYYVIN